MHFASVIVVISVALLPAFAAPSQSFFGNAADLLTDSRFAGDLQPIATDPVCKAEMSNIFAKRSTYGKSFGVSIIYPSYVSEPFYPTTARCFTKLMSLKIGGSYPKIIQSEMMDEDLKCALQLQLQTLQEMFLNSGYQWFVDKNFPIESFPFTKILGFALSGYFTDIDGHMTDKLLKLSERLFDAHVRGSRIASKTPATVFVSELINELVFSQRPAEIHWVMEELTKFNRKDEMEMNAVVRIMVEAHAAALRQFNPFVPGIENLLFYLVPAINNELKQLPDQFLRRYVNTIPALILKYGREHGETILGRFLAAASQSKLANFFGSINTAWKINGGTTMKKLPQYVDDAQFPALGAKTAPPNPFSGDKNLKADEVDRQNLNRESISSKPPTGLAKEEMAGSPSQARVDDDEYGGVLDELPVSFDFLNDDDDNPREAEDTHNIAEIDGKKKASAETNEATRSDFAENDEEREILGELPVDLGFALSPPK